MVWAFVTAEGTGTTLAACGLAMIASTAGVVLYAVYCLLRAPAIDVHAYSTRTTLSDKPVMVLLGDSITEGNVGADWVAKLRLLHPTIDFVNAGIHAQNTWQVGQRLDAVLALNPVAVLLLCGTNDTVGFFSPKLNEILFQRSIPHRLTREFLCATVESILKRIQSTCQAAAIVTLPPLGEVPASRANTLISRHNEDICRIAARQHTTVLDLNGTLWSRVGAIDGRCAAREYTGVPPGAMLVAAIRHYVLGYSWDQVAASYGMRMLVDGIHLSDRSGHELLHLVHRFVTTHVKT